MKRQLSGAGLLTVCMLAVAETAYAQSRGVYPLGMTAVGSGVTPDPGFTYANQLLFYSRDESKADDGSTLPVSGQNAVIMDMNSFVWVSRRTFLGGAHYSAVATLPVAKNQLVSDIHGQLGGGGGFADSYYLPLILGWNKERASIRALAGFLAPPGASPRVPATTSDPGIGHRRCRRGRPCSSRALTRWPSRRSNSMSGIARSKARARSLAIPSTSTTR